MSHISLPIHNSNFWHKSDGQVSLGCVNCPELDICGGLSLQTPFIGCGQLCKCNTPEALNFICKCNPELYTKRVREVGGYDLSNIPNSRAIPVPILPDFIPMIYNGHNREDFLNAEAIAVPLHELFRRKNGDCRFSSAQDLSSRFKFSPSAKLIIVGIGKDRYLESFWSVGRSTGLIQAIARLRPTMITTPNFSLFTDVPRWDNFHNMKRIARCWYEFAEAGVPTALHVNARTDHDWSRWKDFLISHPEIGAIAYEFRTGPAALDRGKWHARKLVELASRIDRPLDLFIRGGQIFLRNFRDRFRSVVFLSSDPFIKTMKRQKLASFNTKRAKWASVWTLLKEPLDKLLIHNVNMAHRYIDSQRTERCVGVQQF